MEVRLVNENSRKEALQGVLSVVRVFNENMKLTLERVEKLEPAKAKAAYEKERYSACIYAFKSAKKSLSKYSEYSSLKKYASRMKFGARFISAMCNFSISHEVEIEDVISHLELKADAAYDLLRVFVADSVAEISEGNDYIDDELRAQEMLEYNLQGLNKDMERRYRDFRLRRSLRNGEISIEER